MVRQEEESSAQMVDPAAVTWFVYGKVVVVVDDVDVGDGCGLCGIFLCNGCGPPRNAKRNQPRRKNGQK